MDISHRKTHMKVYRLTNSCLMNRPREYVVREYMSMTPNHRRRYQPWCPREHTDGSHRLSLVLTRTLSVLLEPPQATLRNKRLVELGLPQFANRVQTTNVRSAQCLNLRFAQN